MSKLIKASSPQALALAIKHLQQGDVIGLPTDTVYGVGALAFNAEAVAKIYQLKNRPANKAMPVFIQSVAHLEQVCQPVSSSIINFLEKYWPGQLTVILPAISNLPSIVTNNQPTVAVRIPNHPVILALLSQLNQPLAVTSANISNHPTPSTAQAVQKQFADRLKLILDDGPSPSNVASTIVDLTQLPPKILRQGKVKIAIE